MNEQSSFVESVCVESHCVHIKWTFISYSFLFMCSKVFVLMYNRTFCAGNRTFGQIYISTYIVGAKSIYFKIFYVQNIRDNVYKITWYGHTYTHTHIHSPSRRSWCQCSLEMVKSSHVYKCICDYYIFSSNLKVRASERPSPFFYLLKPIKSENQSIENIFHKLFRWLQYGMRRLRVHKMYW